MWQPSECNNAQKHARQVVRWFWNSGYKAVLRLQAPLAIEQSQGMPQRAYHVAVATGALVVDLLYGIAPAHLHTCTHNSPQLLRHLCIAPLRATPP